MCDTLVCVAPAVGYCKGHRVGRHEKIATQAHIGQIENQGS
jgi:hypothetical protein